MSFWNTMTDRRMIGSSEVVSSCLFESPMMGPSRTLSISVPSSPLTRTRSRSRTRSLKSTRLIDLLRRTLIAQLDGVLSYSRGRRAFYFTANTDTIKRVYAYRSLKSYTSAHVVKQYEKDGKVVYVRHHAFEPRFWRIGNQWYLSITPTFVFTWDGFRPDRYAASRLAGKKKLEHQAALTGQFVMWRHLLIGETHQETVQLLEPEPVSERLLHFQSLDPLIMPRSVPEEVWRVGEPAVSAPANQRLLGI